MIRAGVNQKGLTDLAVDNFSSFLNLEFAPLDLHCHQITINMKKLLFGFVAAAFLSSCSLTTPVGATSNAVGSKVGEAGGTCYLYQICLGVDAGVAAAARAGGIKKISTVDYKVDNLLGVLVTHTCIVTGE